ncbi:TIGR02530 family flagellar biosynthesis protein [Desulforamulus ruminis]|uniref:Flagellar operon protein n=2 Tax=Desulforamulus ruminis TaxID=1564 RepID=F6DNS4_DESRL|nr:TIGR02530 family flagellar biosynthesis protein [Desulforamulus ruminis]AEG59519.1 flagellar operon protein [Desulforamulus ruminis DSM 2154]
MEAKSLTHQPAITLTSRTTAQAVPPRNTGLKNSRLSFEEMLQREVHQQPQPVKLSAHAEKRLAERNISLTEADFSKINKAVQQAATKGSRDSLLIYGDLTLVASITNRTVVTAVDRGSMSEHVFTNIDSAVFIK